MKMTSLKKKCEECGEEFTYSPSKLKKYCSSQCYHQAQKNGKYKYQFEKRIKNRYLCSYCGKEVIASKRKKRNGEVADNIFCDRQCYDKFRRLNTDRVCLYCGKHFIAICDKKKAQFCDDVCRRKYFKEKTKVKCEICGKVFYPWRVIGNNKLVRNEPACSVECLEKLKKKNEEIRCIKISNAFTGRNHPNWQGGRYRYRGENWSHQKYLAKIRDKYTCQNCGIKQKDAIEKYGKGLEVHHIKPYIFFNNDYIKANELSNLVSLCRSCHQKIEWQYRKGHKDEYKEYKKNK